MDIKKIRVMVVIGVLFVSLSAILIRLSNAHPLIIGMYRLFIAGFLSMLFIRRKDLKEFTFSKGLLFQILLSGFFLGLHFATWNASLNYTSIASSTVLVNTQTFFVLFVSIFLFKEKIDKKVFSYIMAAFLGSIIITIGDSSIGSNHLYGDFLALLGAVFVAGYMIMGRIIRKTLPLSLYTTSVYFIAAFVLMFSAVLSNVDLRANDPYEYLIFFGLAVFCTMMGHTVFNWALKYLQPTYISSTILLEPVFSTIWGIFLFKEIPNQFQIIGGFTIIISIYMYLKTPLPKTNKASLK